MNFFNFNFKKIFKFQKYNFRSFEELEFYKSIYISVGKRSLYAKAIELGLEPLAQQILDSNSLINPKLFINPSKDGLKNHAKVLKGAQDILVHLIVKNKHIMEKIRDLKFKYSFKIESKKVKSAADVKEAFKFENYFDFTSNSNMIKPHQILALFRGENLKVLKVSFVIHDKFSIELLQAASRILLKSNLNDNFKLFKAAFDEAFNKRISPFLKRQFKNELQQSAEKAAITSFADNLKGLLLTCPVKGRKILGKEKLKLILKFLSLILTLIYKLINFLHFYHQVSTQDSSTAVKSL